jgi:hypothetical protein
LINIRNNLLGSDLIFLFIFNLRCTINSKGKIIAQKPETTQQSSEIKKVHLLNGSLAYNVESQFDLAILEVVTPFIPNSNVKIATLPTRSLDVATNLTVSGWGTTSESK